MEAKWYVGKWLDIKIMETAGFRTTQPSALFVSTSVHTARRTIPWGSGSFGTSFTAPLWHAWRKAAAVVRAPTFARMMSVPAASSSAASSAAAGAAKHESVRDVKAQSGGATARHVVALEGLRFDNSFVRELPGDPKTDNYVRQVESALYSKVMPTDPATNDQSNMLGEKGAVAAAGLAYKQPTMLAWSPGTASLLDLAESEGYTNPLAVRVFAGIELLPGMEPYAACYGGHQFGNWAGQLGDGRAITLGEVINSRDERWELQLKGAGRTPYSRFADGRAVLRSSIREFLCSEAMHYLGIPTTRALSLVATGAGVVRDMFYSGNARLEPGAVVCRVAPSFLRVGSFELPVSRGDQDLTKQVADYAIKVHFPDLADMSKDPADEHNAYAEFLRRVIRSNAELVACWQTIGFVHGVLNTDNTSILGLTIDYGPYGFLDEYDPTYTPNTTDMPGRRYCYARQPGIILWNLLQLAQSIAHLTGVPAAERELNAFKGYFEECVSDRWRQKLGFKSWADEQDNALLGSLLDSMQKDKVDFTNLFRGLNTVRVTGNDCSTSTSCVDVLTGLNVLPRSCLEESEARGRWSSWFGLYLERVAKDCEADAGWTDESRIAMMNKANPVYILRNYLCQRAIDAAEQGDESEILRLLKLVQNPFEDQPGMEEYRENAPSWSKRPGVCVNSCSS
ncbi:UPF0061 protein [Porphyridium purpureum]|uniref:Selenoprotein O n=1 Tax=Porphyridium purpureum TaxID=35688 RepID=A0A5J4YNG4_PORPP|nr:UPF0061 protein [Porphyridium purpureum]|eukprot:POR0788..scf222_8